MKKFFLKYSFLLVIMISITMSSIPTVAYAKQLNTNESIEEDFENYSSVRCTINPNERVIQYLELSDTGFSRKFVANASSESTSGLIEISLYNPDGKLVSNQWVLGVNEAATWTVYFPKKGTWEISALAYLTNEPVLVYFTWSN